jgi:hypothetical protein
VADFHQTPNSRRRIPGGLVSLALIVLAAALACTAVRHPPRPKLVVTIVVDQLRQEYLNRLQDQLDGGIARLLEQGAVFTDAHLAHYPSVTAVGHAALLTGATPALHGIIGNDWFDRGLGRNVASVSDDAVGLLGAEGAAASPRHLLVSTVGDELKTAGPAKVIGISRKDRAAILSVGRMADAAYWVDGLTGRFVTSTWYMDALPRWLVALNESDPVGRYAGRAWRPLDGQGEAFVTLPAEPREDLVDALGDTPFSNEILVECALVAIEAERLGQRGVTDLLVVSFSANDSIGHDHGPESPEVRDATRRTDRDIARLLDAVDAAVGLEHALVVLTSDHGVAPIPEEQVKRRMPGGRMTGAELFDPIEAALDARLGDGQWILGTAGSSPYLDHELIRERGLDPARVREMAAEAAQEAPHVARVFTREQLLRGDVGPGPFALRVAASYHPRRSGDLEILIDPYWMRSGHGTTHGTPYPYDTHIPLVFRGPGIRPGRYHRHADLNDVAATVATLIATELPSGCSGRVLHEMLDVGAD